MAIYRIEAPDGKTYRLEGPPGASHDELVQALKAKFPYADLTTQELKDMPRAPMSLGDTARSGIAGLLGAVGSIASAAGAETETARGIRKYGDEFIEGMTPARKEEMQREAEISRRAEGKGPVEEIKADVRSVTDAPVQAVAQGLGSSVPAIVAGLGVMAAGAPATIAVGVALFAKLAIGALQGAGETKASIFDSVTQQLMEQKGLSRAEAEAEATKAQEYLGKNSLGILGGAGAGMLDSVLGVESIFGKTAKAAKTPLFQPSKLTTTGKVAFGEAVPEGIQGGVGKLAENVALQNAGIDTEMFSGVAGSVARDALMGALTGSAVSPLQYANLRREYEADKERRFNEEKAKIDEAVRIEEEQMMATARKADEEILAEPPQEIQTPENLHPIRNPLGNFSKQELQAGVPEAIDAYRKQFGLPKLDTYSIEDIVDAMPGIDPELEKKHIDNILTMRTGYKGESLVPKDVWEQAAARDIAKDDPAFKDFLLRTTGEDDVRSMSQPQLYAAFKAINELPEDAELEIGTNAARFTEQQYKAAIKALDKEIGEKAVYVDEALSNIKLNTGLTTDKFAKSILDAAVRRGDLDRKGKVVSAPTTAEVLPKGYTIQEGMFEKGEKPEGFQVKIGENLIDQVFTTEDAAQRKADELTSARGKVINQLNNRIEQAQAAIDIETSKLNQFQTVSGTEDIEYKKFEASVKQIVKKAQKDIAEYESKIADLSEESLPVSVVVAPVRKVKAKGFTLFKDNKAVQVFKTRDQAEQAILEGLPDEEIQALTKAKGRRTLKKKAEQEAQRRVVPKEPEAAPEVEKQPKAEFEPALRALLDKFGLQNVALNIEKDMKAGGEYSKSVIKIALDNANPVRTLRHESVHALKELGFFTPQQWKTLENEAKSKWIETYLKQRNINGDPLEEGQQSRYDAYMDVYGGDQDAIIEEAIADAFGDFDMNKAPPGLMTSILKRLKLFFEALQNALTGAGFQTYEDVFGKAERGELVSTQPVVKPSEPKYDKTDAWQATPEERQEAMEMYDKDGFLPYVSQGRLNIPIDDVKYSLQKFNPEKHLTFDPTLNVPINKDGTVTLYYHTTKEESLAINGSKTIPAGGKNRIYLTNESSGAKILVNKGGMEQTVDGSTVLVYATPDMLQVDTIYEDGRVDLYIPVAQGEYFNKKMKQHSIQKARSQAIAKEFSYEDHENRISTAVQQYQNASPQERKALLKQARQLLKREHNIGSLLTENGKLEKTRIGDYNLSYDGLPVASQGLGLASAQKITEKTSTCPRSSICEGLCLGETSGGNFMFGGAAAEDVGDIQKSAFRAGARMIQYLKTEALIVNPEAFAVVLQAEIDSLKKWSASPTVRKKNPETGKVQMMPKDIYAPAVRLNVTSDFKPSMFRGVIDGNKDVMFYDYTKINSDTIAPNHHLTYSSTGFGQIVDGTPVFFKNPAGRYDHNWGTVRERLNNGFNVAMAFSSKSALPKFLSDEASGKTYRVLDGDLYDARYLDQYSQEKEASGDTGVIVGLRNKAGTLSEKSATVKTGGFFVNYDPKVDGDTVVVPDQAQFKEVAPSKEAEPSKTIPIKQVKYSLRDTPQFKQWFGNSKVVNEDGTPKVMYHGTARDIAVFQPKQAGAIFLTEDPKFAKGFTSRSENYMVQEIFDSLSPEELQQITKQAEKIAKKKGTFAEDEIRGVLMERLPSRANIMPVYVSAQNPFDYQNPNHIKKLKEVYGDADTLKAIRQGSWIEIESSDVQEAIKFAGFDGFYVKEGGKKNLAVYNPEQLKSATGNVGTFDQYNPDIRYNLRDTTDPTIRAAVDQVTTPRDTRGFVERITGALKDDDAWSKFRANALNRYNRLGEYDKALLKKMGGARLLADSSAEAAALMSDLGAGLTASALGVHDRAGGIPVYKNGVTTVTNLNNTVKGPVAIFAPLSKYGDPYIYQLYQFWAGAKRGKRLMADGREQVYTPAMLSYANKLEKQYPEFVTIQKEWVKFNNGLVQFLVDTGVLSQDKADEFTKYSDYVPFYRQMDGDTTIGPNLFSSISGVKGPKKLKGGEAPLADFLETIVRNTQSSIQMGIKNVAAARAADVAVKINEATRLNTVSSGPGVFTVMENGKLAYYQSSDELFINAIKSLNLPDLPFIGFWAAPANVLRNLVTKDPGFMLANMVRDSMSAYVTSGANYKPVISTIANFGKSIAGTSPEYQTLLNAGLIGGYEFSQTTDQSSRTMEEAMRIKAGIRKGKDIPMGIWQALEKGTTASDAATRIEVYKSTMAETGNEAEALFRAMEVMNFNRKGSSAVVRVLTAAVPFLNARMQGLDVLYRAGISPTVRGLFGKDVTDQDKALQKTFLVRGLTMMALSCMYWALTHDDDEYKKQEQEVRDNYWLVPPLGLKIPIPFEVGVLFKTIPERIMAYSFGDDTGKDFARAMGRQLSSTLAFNPIPQTVLPIVEIVTNHSFFTGRDVVPQGLEDIDPKYQIGPGTSLFAQTLGQSLGLSPIKVDHLIKGYTGTIGDYAVNLVDMVLDLNSNSPKVSKRVEQMPFIKRFMLDPDARGTVTAFYDLKNEVDKVTRTINLLERTTKLEDMGEYLTENINVLAVKEHIQDLEKDMKELRELKAVIRNSTHMSGDEKRDALLEVTKLENNLTSNTQRLKKLASK